MSDVDQKIDGSLKQNNFLRGSSWSRPLGPGSNNLMCYGTIQSPIGGIPAIAVVSNITMNYARVLLYKQYPDDIKVTL